MSDALELSETDPTIARLHIGRHVTDWMRRGDAVAIHAHICRLTSRIAVTDGIVTTLIRAIETAHDVAERIDHEDGR